MLYTGLDTDWGYEYKNNKFFLYIPPATHELSYREACVLRANELYQKLPNPVLSLSGGLDSQIVLHSFYEQGYKIDCIFRHLVGYNDNELENISILKKKYNFNIHIVKMNPNEFKKEILEEYKQTNILPNQLLFKKFYSMISNDLDIIEGPDGPHVFLKNNNLYFLETYNSFEFSRIRAVGLLGRKGKFISYEKNSNILLSIFNDEIYEYFCSTYNYFLNNSLVQKIYLIDFWDVYIKPYIYYKHWKNELLYFSKFQGIENVDWIFNGPKHNYKKNMISIPLKKIKEILTNFNSNYVKFEEDDHNV